MEPTCCHGQCRLMVKNSSTLDLWPFNGNNLIINGKTEHISDAGVHITNDKLNPDTFYYVYVYMDDNTGMAMAFSQDKYVNQNGIAVRNDDNGAHPGEVLVGAVYTTSAGNFTDEPDARFCLSYFNRRAKYLEIGQGSEMPFLFTTPEEIRDIKGGRDLRCYFITWFDECVQSSSDGEVSANGAANISISYQNSINVAPKAQQPEVGEQVKEGDKVALLATGTDRVGRAFTSNNGAGYLEEGRAYYTTLYAAVDKGAGYVDRGYTHGTIAG